MNNAIDLQSKKVFKKVRRYKISTNINNKRIRQGTTHYNIGGYDIRALLKPFEGRSFEFVGVINGLLGEDIRRRYFRNYDDHEFNLRDLYGDDYNDPPDFDEIRIIEGIRINMPAERVVAQFRDGDTHCFLQPIINDIKKRYRNTKNKNLRTVIRKCENFLKIYDDGVPEDKIQEICNELNCTIELLYPMKFKNKVVYTSNRNSTRKYSFIVISV